MTIDVLVFPRSQRAASAGGGPGNAVPAGYADFRVRGFRPAGVALAALLIAAPCYAQDDEAARKRRLTDLERRITNVRESVDETVEREKSELVQLEQIDQLSTLLVEQTQLLERAVSDQAAKVQQADLRLREAQADYDAKKAALKERLVALYKMGEMSYARLLLSVEDSADLATAYAYVTQLVEEDRRRVQAYTDALAALARERDSIAEKAGELRRLEEANASKQKELKLERARRQTAIERIRREKTRYLQALAELEASAQQLRKLLNELPASGTSLNMIRFKGALRWPHPGRITLGFGLHKHPQFNTITIQNGIDIDAEYGDAVTAVFGGKVVFADWFRGYGNLVILDHGDKFFSLYAHLSRISAALGDMTLPGQVVGYVGDTGSLKGAYLYFELRQGEKPLNPVEWLEKRRHVG